MYHDGSLLITDAGNGRIRKLTPYTNSSGTLSYRSTTYIGGKGEKDCVGAVHKGVQTTQYTQEVKTSLSMLCHSKPVHVEHVSSCGENSAVQAPRDITVYSQLFGPGNFTSNAIFVDSPSNIVIVDKACPTTP